tara:strand:- start:1070 stop:1207 length:138 start_codon:yes stop_codon:yes gene_type:complete
MKNTQDYQQQIAMAKNVANLKLNSTKKLQVNLLLASLLKTLRGSE